jgi:predicted acetyltransferase
MGQAMIAPPRDDGDWEQFTAIEGQSFAATTEATARYVAAVRPDAIARFARDGDRVVAGALALPCRQMIGGRPVPAGAVASVCVVPEARGRGLGRRVMSSLVGAMRDEGLALAPLWPSSVTFYRRLGWEVAGHVSQFSVPSRSLGGRPASGQAVRDPDLGEVQTVRSKGAAGWCGPIERPAWWWAWRMPQPPGDLSYRYGWHEDGRLTGFVAFRQEPPADRRWGFDVWVSDFWAATPDALDGLAGLLASDGAFSPRVRFDYGVLPATPDLVWRVGELDVATSGTNAWMLRVVDPRRAIEASGWPVWADLRLELAIQEPGAAARPIVAELAGGSARVEAGGSGRVRIGSGPFSAWFAGGMRAETAARLGLADGPEDDIAIMDQLTADRRPWLPDMF